MIFAQGRKLVIGHGQALWSRTHSLAQDLPNASLGIGGVLAGSNSSVDALLESFAYNPMQSIKQCRGAFVLAGAQGATCFLARDESGVKTIYWAQTRERLLFASEVKALYADVTLQKEIRLQSIPEFLSFSYIPGKETMFENVYELEPGCCLSYEPMEGGKPKLQRFFRLNMKNLKPFQTSYPWKQSVHLFLTYGMYLNNL